MFEVQLRHRPFGGVNKGVSVGSGVSEKVEGLALAIAKAEGYFLAGALPARYHNPGDLKVRPGERYPGQVGVGKGRHVIFKNDRAGWAALEHQLDKVAARQSKIYTPEMTLQQVAKKYAGNWRVWSRNVAHNLQVTPNTTLADVLEVPPTLPSVPPDWHKIESVLTIDTGQPERQ